MPSVTGACLILQTSTTKGMRDYAFLVIRKHGSPIHFREVARQINLVFKKKAHTATTHNELIKDPRFVLVGRGLYALKEWGYMSGVVKDVIAPFSRERSSYQRADRREGNEGAIRQGKHHHRQPPEPEIFQERQGGAIFGSRRESGGITSALTEQKTEATRKGVLFQCFFVPNKCSRGFRRGVCSKITFSN